MNIVHLSLPALLLASLSLAPARAQDVQSDERLAQRLTMLEQAVASLDTRLELRTTGSSASVSSLDQDVSIIARLQQLEREVDRLSMEMGRLQRQADAAAREASQAQRLAMEAERLARMNASRIR